MTTVENRLGNLGDNANGQAGQVWDKNVLAYAFMERLSVAGEEGAVYVTVDLSRTDYVGEVFLSSARPMGNKVLHVYSIEFIGKRVDDTTEYHPDYLYPIDTSAPSYASSNSTFGQYVYIDMGADDLDSEGNWTEKSYSVLLGNFDLSKYAAVEIYYTSNGLQYDSRKAPLALSKSEGVLGNLYETDGGDLSSPDILTYGYLSPIVVAQEHGYAKTVLDLTQVEYSGELYLSTGRITGNEHLRITAIKFIGAPAVESSAPTYYTVTWKVEGQDDVTETYEAGATPVYPNGTPEKAAEEGAEYVYRFVGWTPSVEAVSGEVAYTAQFERHYADYSYPIVAGAQPEFVMSNAAGCVCITLTGTDSNDVLAYSVSLGEMDLSKYAAVRITYGGDASVDTDGTPIGLAKSDGRLGNLGDNSAGDVTSADLLAYAYMDMQITTSYQIGTTYVTIDLSNVDYNGSIGAGESKQDIGFIVTGSDGLKIKE